jgi:hypothetical protein
MRRIIDTAALLMLVFMVAGLNGCLVEDREVEIVLNGENCETFDVMQTSESFITPQFMAIGEELDSLLADNEVSREQIQDAFLVSASYEVKEFTHEVLYPNWDLEGVITVERFDITDSPDTLVIYTNITISDEIVGEKTYAVFHEDGVAKVNQAIDDYLSGGYPMLLLRIENSNAEPEPSPSLPIDFSWEFCLFIQVITALDTEIFQPF